MSININEIFKSRFPVLADQFDLKPFQERVIRNVIEQGSTLAIMPTGGGKSLIYWLSAHVSNGICLVVSPLIALIDEQAEKLSNEGFSVLTIHGGMGASEQLDVLKDFARGTFNPDFVFISPERMATDGFFEYCLSLQKNKIKLLVIDEIHCVSQWGFDFRPFYKRIPVFLNEIFNDNWPIILGLTATINPLELTDICTDFKISHNAILKDDVLLRFDIEMHVEKYVNEKEKEARLWELIKENPGKKVLIYLYRKYHKRGVEDLSQKAVENGISAISFHGDLSGGDRQEILRDFKAGNINVVFATNAFGMGIDIPDIRIVIHFMLPESIEQYYQEIGRAGRDGNGAISYMLYTNKNVDVRKRYFIDKAFPVGEEIKNLFRKATNNEVGKKTLQYFAEEDLQSVLPYFLNCGAISIKAKGFTGLKVFKINSNLRLQQIIDSSRTGMVIPVLLRPEYTGISCKDFFNIIYRTLVNGEARLSKSLDKCLIIEAYERELTGIQLEAIELESTTKRGYKHNLLDYLVYLLDNFDNTKSLHQEIGRYLGVDKHLLGKIHRTESGIWVRSKSELIIANILYRSELKFEYEKKLYYSPGKWKEPDFTIEHNGHTWYWEHLGLLGDAKYNKDWQDKVTIYNRIGIFDHVITTKESAVLSNQVNEEIKRMKVKS